MTAKSYGYSTVSGAVEAVDGEKPNINHIRRAAKICEGSKNVCVVPKIARRVFLKKTQRANTFRNKNCVPTSELHIIRPLES